jgi:hypothetical protein
MKHSELLALIEPMTNDDAIFMKDAIKAILELHKPLFPNPSMSTAICCGCLTIVMYPCPTIKAIVEHLTEIPTE